jgi:hypothetical protein
MHPNILTKSAIAIASSFVQSIRRSSRCGTIPSSFLNTRCSILALRPTHEQAVSTRLMKMI